jgi:hypothetical protein
VYKNNHIHLPSILCDAFLGALFTYFIDFFRTQAGRPDLSASETLILWLLLSILLHLGGLLMVALIDRLLTNQNPTADSKMLVEVMPLPEINDEFQYKEDNDPFWSTVEADNE